MNKTTNPLTYIKGFVAVIVKWKVSEGMSNHYYSDKPQVAHDRRATEAVLRGFSLRFVTDAGVFSKNGIDYGSRVLIDAIELPSGARVLDVGCGYGPMGLTAAKLVPDGHVTMIDINERAVELSRKMQKRTELTMLRYYKVIYWLK